MKTQLQCIPCFARQALDAVNQAVPEPDRREPILRRLMQEIALADWNTTPPAIAQHLQRVIRRELDNPDPYRDIKQQMNRAAIDLLPVVRDYIQSHPNPLEAAVRASIAGNLLDVGAKTQIAAHELEAHLQSIWNQPLCGHFDRLANAIANANRIVYLADNAGEIIFDKLLVEQLDPAKTTLFVRGAPVLNDATLADAATAGLTDLVPVFDNGSDAPGTILDDCSPQFRQHFNSADLIIAKGQGNYETLSSHPGPIFFLFTVKCELVSSRAGHPVGSLLVLTHHNK